MLTRTLLPLVLHLFLTFLVRDATCGIFPQAQLFASVCECADVNSLVTEVIVMNTNNEDISISRNCEDYFLTTQIILNIAIRIQVKGFDLLDFETTQSYVCTLSAVDSDGTESTVELGIYILDCNDNEPKFISNILTTTVPEDTSVGDTLFTVSASDADSGVNGVFSFSIDDTTGKFIIGGVTGKIDLVSNLDFETQREFDLVVTVTDHGDPAAASCPGNPLSSNEVVTIVVSDSADTPPVFTDDCCMFSVAECAPINTLVGTFMAYDGDVQVNDSVEFSFLVVPSCFALNTDGSLTVFTENCLDRESSNFFKLNVEATEVHAPKQSVRATFDIEITDCNDNAPKFDSLPSSYSVNEGLPPDSTLFSIQTSDDDEANTNNSMVFVTILPNGNTDSIFAINTHSTALICTQLLDRERHPNGFQLTLKVTDYGSPPLSSTHSLTLSLNDINDNPPTFNPTNYSQTIEENLPPGMYVLTINASDVDIGTNAEITFNIISGNDDNYLSLNQVTGEILTTNNKIDRETSASIELTVSATDSGINPLQATASVQILISDQNDNSPIFSPLSYNFSVAEEQSPTSVSLMIVATDLDDVSNGYGAVSYSIISGNEENIFYLNSTFIHTNVSFDRETRDEYSLIIRAEDNGIPSRSSTALVLIVITDTNDNTPVFTRDTYIVGFSEEAEFETQIIQFVVTDEDIPPYSLVVFEIETLIQGFVFESQTGQLFTDKLFDGRAGESFDFTITAYDNKKTGEFNSVSKPVKVIVIKETDRLIALINSPIDSVRSMETTYRDLLGDITNDYVNIEDFVPVETENQVDSSQTQIIFHVINLDTESVIDPGTVLKGVDEQFEDVVSIFDEFFLVSISQYPVIISSPYVFPVLVSIVSILAALLCLTCCCCSVLFFYIKYYRKKVKKSERDLDEAGNLLTQHHAKSFSSLSAVGTSGVFAQSDVAIMENPLWIHPYDTLGSFYSNDSTLYETKELIIDLFSEDLDEYSLYSVPSRVNTSLLEGPYEMHYTDSNSSIDPEDLDDLQNSEVEDSSFDFPSTSSKQKIALDAISEDSEGHLSII